MEFKVFFPHTQVILAVWILADRGSLVDDCRERAETLETVADVAIQRYHDLGIQAGESRRVPDVRDS